MIAAIDQLIALFNQRSLDVPDGFFTRNTQFLLNGVPFEQMLGRAPTDPLVLMLARGAAGYRFAIKAVQHAIPDVHVQRGELDESHSGGEARVRGQVWLSGRFRGTGTPAEVLMSFELAGSERGVERVAVTLDQEVLARLRDARLQP